MYILQAIKNTKDVNVFTVLLVLFAPLFIIVEHISGYSIAKEKILKTLKCTFLHFLCIWKRNGNQSENYKEVRRREPQQSFQREYSDIVLKELEWRKFDKNKYFLCGNSSI